MTEPIRWVQTNLRETDAAMDPEKFIGEIADFNAKRFADGNGRDLGLLSQQSAVSLCKSVHAERP